MCRLGICGFSIVLLLLGCTPDVETLDDHEACETLASGLDDAGLGWPVAQDMSRLSKESLESVANSFRFTSSKSRPALHSALNAWLETFDKAIPYLIKSDEQGFSEIISTDEGDRFFDANITITQICKW